MSIPIRHEPILIETTFHGLDFLTAPGRVFTPRATTEALVDAALARIGGREVRVADVGTGAGVIAVSIAAAAPQVEVFATDISAAAVELARENAARNGVADRVHVLEGDLLDPVPEPVEIVVANLPYLPESEHRPEYDGEPPEAIYAPGDGLGPLRQLLNICEAGKLAMPGFAIVQYRGEVHEADCQHLPELRQELAEHAEAAA
jgi:release factor glutamine methyltransferase